MARKPWRKNTQRWRRLDPVRDADVYAMAHCLQLMQGWLPVSTRRFPSFPRILALQFVRCQYIRICRKSVDAHATTHALAQKHQAHMRCTATNTSWGILIVNTIDSTYQARVWSSSCGAFLQSTGRQGRDKMAHRSRTAPLLARLRCHPWREKGFAKIFKSY